MDFKCSKCFEELSEQIYEFDEKEFCKKCYIQETFGIRMVKINHKTEVTERYALSDSGALRLCDILSVEKNIDIDLYQYLLPTSEYIKGNIIGTTIRRILKLKQPRYESLMTLESSEIDLVFCDLAAIVQKFHSKGNYMGILSLETVGMYEGDVKIVDCSYVTDNECADSIRDLPEYTYTAPLNSLSLERPNKITDLESLIYLYMVVKKHPKMKKIKSLTFKELKALKNHILKRLPIPEGEGFYISNVFFDIIESKVIDSI